MRLSSASTSRRRFVRVASSDLTACCAAASASLVERCSSSARAREEVAELALDQAQRVARVLAHHEAAPRRCTCGCAFCAWLRRMLSWRSFSSRSALRPMNRPMMTSRVATDGEAGHAAEHAEHEQAAVAAAEAGHRPAGPCPDLELGRSRVGVGSTPARRSGSATSRCDRERPPRPSPKCSATRALSSCAASLRGTCSCPRRPRRPGGRATPRTRPRPRPGRSSSSASSASRMSSRKRPRRSWSTSGCRSTMPSLSVCCHLRHVRLLQPLGLRLELGRGRDELGGAARGRRAPARSVRNCDSSWSTTASIVWPAARTLRLLARRRRSRFCR